MIRRGLLAMLLLAGCARAVPPGPTPQPRYVVGAPYVLGGLWSYPTEQFDATETGLAERLPTPARGRLTANGESFDPTALMAAHRTLPLPTIALVTNLENGLQVAVRVNERGPERPGRLLGLSTRAATLLGVADGVPARIRLEVDAARSRELADSLPAESPRGPRIESAPIGAVTREELTPSGGAAARTPIVPASSPDRPSATPPERLPETVTRSAAAPGSLIIEVGRFHGRGAAQLQASRLGTAAAVEPIGTGRNALWRVRLGPYASVAAADEALGALLRGGTTEARLRVEPWR